MSDVKSDPSSEKLEVDITVPASDKSDKLELDISVPAGSEGLVEIALKQCKLESCKKAINPKRKDQEFCSAKHRKEFHHLQRKVG
jgi:hypothetical protein